MNHVTQVKTCSCETSWQHCDYYVLCEEPLVFKLWNNWSNNQME